jgi:hypothetical protein
LNDTDPTTDIVTLQCHWNGPEGIGDHAKRKEKRGKTKEPFNGIVRALGYFYPIAHPPCRDKHDQRDHGADADVKRQSSTQNAMHTHPVILGEIMGYESQGSLTDSEISDTEQTGDGPNQEEETPLIGSEPRNEERRHQKGDGDAEQSRETIPTCVGKSSTGRALWFYVFLLLLHLTSIM